nr:C-type lectin domain-containing type 1 protein 4 [Arenicola marina]
MSCPRVGMKYLLTWLLCWGCFVQHGGAAVTLPGEHEDAACRGTPRSVSLSCSRGYVLGVRTVTDLQYTVTCVRAAACPSDFAYVDELDACYKVVTTETRTWDSAQLECQSVGAFLMEVDTKREHDWIHSELSTRDLSGCGSHQTIWLGGRRVVGETWKWQTSGRMLDPTWWNAGEPNADARENAALNIQYSLYPTDWNDSRDSSNFCYVCEYTLRS